MADSRWLLLVLAAGLAFAACSDDDADARTSSSTTTTASTSAPADAPDDAAYCAEFDRLDVETTEEYVGSPQHVADTEGLLALAPDSVRPALERYRDFLASGFITPDDPESNQTDAWPEDVQADVATIRAETETLC